MMKILKKRDNIEELLTLPSQKDSMDIMGDFNAVVGERKIKVSNYT